MGILAVLAILGAGALSMILTVAVAKYFDYLDRKDKEKKS